MGEPYDPDRDYDCEFACVDWKESPEMVLEAIDRQLRVFGLEIVMLDTRSDDYRFKVGTPSPSPNPALARKDQP